MHHVNICKNGFVHGQCRCPDENKTKTLVECSNDSHKAQLGPYWKAAERLMRKND